MYEFNSCLLAKIISTKTCSQINDYIKNDPNSQNREPQTLTSAIQRSSGKQVNSKNANSSSPSKAKLARKPTNGGKRSRKQRARQTHFLARKLHEEAAGDAEPSSSAASLTTNGGTAGGLKRQTSGTNNGGGGGGGGGGWRRRRQLSCC